jgi:polyisoprenoid-binding protein YceI
MNERIGGRARLASAILSFLVFAVVPSSGQLTDFRLDPAKTSVKFTLDALLHKVDGRFQLKPSNLRLDLASGAASGEIAVDAKSGVTGNAMRDRKMHNDVLESEQYPDIQFRPDRVTGAVARSGKSAVTVHGIFRIHGVDREVSVPATVEITAGSWMATIHFTIPYAKWGMKNPSNLFLHVSDSVEIEVSAVGNVVP